MENLTAKDKEVLKNIAIDAIKCSKIAVIFNRKNYFNDFHIWRGIVNGAFSDESRWREDDEEIIFYKNYCGLIFEVKIYCTEYFIKVRYGIEYDGVREGNGYAIAKGDNLKQAHLKAFDYLFFYDGQVHPRHQLGLDLKTRDWVKELHLNPFEHFIRK